MLAALEELGDDALRNVLDGQHIVRWLPGLDPRHVRLSETLVVGTSHSVDGSVQALGRGRQVIASAAHPAKTLTRPVEEAALFGVPACQLDGRLPRRAVLCEP